MSKGDGQRVDRKGRGELFQRRDPGTRDDTAARLRREFFELKVAGKDKGEDSMIHAVK